MVPVFKTGKLWRLIQCAATFVKVREFFTSCFPPLQSHAKKTKQTGLSPLAPGQWKKFLAVYAGFYVFNNIVRPIRLAASVAVSPRFDDLVLWVQNRFGVRKGIAVTITVIVVNVFGTIFVSAALIGLASALAGVPVFPAKALTK